MKKYFLILFLLVISNDMLHSQNSEIYAEVIARDINRKSQDSIQFELVLKRLSEDWKYFANCTFHLTLDTTQFQFNNSNFGIIRDSSGLMEGVITGNDNPVGGYSFSEKIIPNKVVISILCPETVEESQFLNINDEFVIGKYTVFSLDNSPIPFDIRWITPVNYYQKAAYKLDKDSIRYSIKVFDKNDNLDFNYKRSTKLAFSETYLPYGDTTVLVNFYVDYVGQKQIELSLKSIEELNVVGWVIKKASSYNNLTVPDSAFKTIYTWRTDSVNTFNPEMISKGDTKVGFFYGPLPDSAEYRGIKYCYRLYCNFYDSLKVPIPDEVFLSEKCVKIPNAIIEQARTTNNDFPRIVEMEYTLTDDCLVTAAVYDLTGKIIEKLKDENGNVIDKLPVKKGTHPLQFHPNPSISTGSYYVRLMAYSIDDVYVESSTAIIKLLLLK